MSDFQKVLKYNKLTSVFYKKLRIDVKSKKTNTDGLCIVIVHAQTIKRLLFSHFGVAANQEHAWEL